MTEFILMGPEGLLDKGHVAWVLLPSLDGPLKILPGHTPLIVALRAGPLRWQREGAAPVVAWTIEEGYAQILPQQIILVVFGANRIDHPPS